MVARVTVNASPILSTSQTPTPQSFTQKLIEIDIELGPNPETNQPRSFSNGSNSVTLAGSRASVRVQNSGTPKGSAAQIDVYGLTPSLMNELSTLGMVFQLVPQNTLTVRAGDAVSGLATVFIGTITSAYGDYNRAPDVLFHFECLAGLLNAVVPIAASSFTGPTDVGTIMSGLAKQMGLGFENNGVNIKLNSPYLPGSGQDQWRKVMRDAGIRADVVPGASGSLVLAIWPKGGSRGGIVPLIAPPPAGSMIGYPSFTQQGILVKSIFNPQIGFGGQIKVQSSLPKAQGTWNILKLDHALDSMISNGLWESSMWCFNPDYPQPIPPA